MARKQQHEILVDFLRERGGRATLREIHRNCWIQNVPDAAMRARKKGFLINTVHDPVNPKIASYKLVEPIEVKVGRQGTKTVQYNAGVPIRKEHLQPLFPDTNPYRE